MEKSATFTWTCSIQCEIQMGFLSEHNLISKYQSREMQRQTFSTFSKEVFTECSRSTTLPALISQIHISSLFTVLFLYYCIIVLYYCNSVLLLYYTVFISFSELSESTTSLCSFLYHLHFYTSEIFTLSFCTYELWLKRDQKSGDHTRLDLTDVWQITLTGRW